MTTLKTIRSALTQGSTRNFIDSDEAKNIVKTAKADKKGGVKAVVQLVQKSAVGYGDKDKPGAKHKGPVISDKALQEFDSFLWNKGDFNAFDFRELHSAGVKNGDWKSTAKASPEKLKSLAIDRVMGNYNVRGGDLDDSITARSLPAGAKKFYDEMRAPASNRDVFRFAEGGSVVYGIGVRGADKSSVWLFNDQGKQIAFVSPPGGGEP